MRRSICIPVFISIFSVLLTSRASAVAWKCDVSWHFSVGDKTYRGEGSSEAEALRQAKQRCKDGQALDKLKITCEASPVSKRCTTDIVQPPRSIPKKPKFTTLWCVRLKYPADETRTNNLPYQAVQYVRPHDNASPNFFPLEMSQLPRFIVRLLIVRVTDGALILRTTRKGAVIISGQYQ